jgi:transcriptional regulator of acetoin/glycerol metabolism
MQSMTPNDLLKLAREVADEHEKTTAAPEAPADSRIEPSDPGTSYDALPEPPIFLRDREVREAIRVVNFIASGRNPFSSELFEKLRPEQHESVLQAVCLIVVTLVQTGIAPAAVAPESISKALSAVGTSDPASKRPLEEYLDRVEREAILEALEEAHHNRTAAARLLGITFRALRYRMGRLGMGA